VPKRPGHQVVRKIGALRQKLSAFDRSLRRLAAMVSQLDGRIERRRSPGPGLAGQSLARPAPRLVLRAATWATCGSSSRGRRPSQEDQGGEGSEGGDREARELAGR